MFLVVPKVPRFVRLFTFVGLGCFGVDCPAYETELYGQQPQLGFPPRTTQSATLAAT